MVATGPMPGSTPIRVPTIEPINAYNRLTGVRATLNPRARWLRRSMAVRSVRPGPDCQLELQPDDEYSNRQGRKQDRADNRLLRSELRTRRAGQHDQYDRGQYESDVSDDQPEQHHAADHDQCRAPFPRWNRAALQPQCAQRKRSTKHDQHDPKDAREIAGSHACRATERVIGADNERGGTEGDENQTGIEILGMANERHCSSSRSSSLGETILAA